MVSLAFDVLPSFLPFGTSQVGPPDCLNSAKPLEITLCVLSSDSDLIPTHYTCVCVIVSKSGIFLLTITTASLAANAKISAQDTTPGHEDSTAFFALSIT